MAAPPLHALVRQIERLSVGRRGDNGQGTTDRQLLDDFTARHNESAFAELVARHGPMVMRVCRRVLHHVQDAEDAFQATFLVLARSTGSIRNRDAVAEFLHGVAYRTAMSAKRTAARRRNHEGQMRGRASPSTASPTWDDVQAILDEEIQRLPQLFRSAFVMCVLEGKTEQAAAVELGCKEGTVSSRLTRARQRLQKQLLRRGIKLGVLLAAVCVADGAARAAVPVRLSETTLRYGLLVAAGKTVAGTIPPHVAALATGVTRAMLLNKVRTAAIGALVIGLVAAGAGLLKQQVVRAEDKPATVRPEAKPAAEPVKPADQMIEVSGRVLDPEGKPVAKARLYREHRLTEPAIVPEDFDVISLGVTDDEGRFHVKMPPSKASAKLAVGSGGTSGVAGGGGAISATAGMFSRPTSEPSTIVAAADGFGLNWVHLPSGEKPGEQTIRLVKDQKVRGRLVDSEGQPVVGVTVTVKGLTEPVADVLEAVQRGDGRVRNQSDGLEMPLNKVLHVTATDKDGRFEITGAGADRIGLLQLHSEFAVLTNVLIATQDGFDPNKAKSWPRPGMTPMHGPMFECVVVPSRPIEGTVLSADKREPVAKAEVTGNGARQTVKALTDDKGHYKLIGLPKADRYRITVTPAKDAPFLIRHVEAADRPGLERVLADVELTRGVMVSGRITDRVTGNGLACQVSAVALPENEVATKLGVANSRLQPVLSDADGRFSLVVLPGLNLLTVRSVTTAMLGVPVNCFRPAELDEADRRLVKLDNNTIPALHGIAVLGGTEFLEHLNAVKVLDVKKDGGSVTASLTLDPGKTLTVHVQDTDGKPLTGAIAGNVAATDRSVVSLKDADCPVVGLDPQQPRQIALLHVERKLAALVTVRGDEKDSPTVRLAPTGTVTGRLLDDAGKPLVGADIRVRYVEDAARSVAMGSGRAKIQSDKEGRFRVEGVIPGAKFNLTYVRAGESFTEVKQTERGPFKSDEKADLGDLAVKPRSRPQ
jgi:RNA polymerase sigma factor (sigma-70 family)